MANKKININVPEDLLARIDEEAELKHMTRTAYIIRAVSQMAEADAFIRKSPDIQRKLTELNDALSSVAATSDKDFAGIIGQQSLL